MKRIRWVLIAAAGWMAAGCGDDRADRPDGELDAVRAYAEAEVRIEHLRKKAVVDWAAVRAQYEVTAPTVKRIDAAHGTDYDAEIRAALAKCAAGDAVKVNLQVLAKGLQHVTVLAIEDELAGLGAAGPENRRRAARAAAYFEGIRPTLVRRDETMFGGRKTLEPAADAALGRLRKAAEGGVEALPAACRGIEDLIARTFALSVLYEVQEIERLRDRDPAKCAVKLKEAEIFYRIIRARVRRRDPKANERIRAVLSGDYANMSAAALEAALKQGLPKIPLR